MSTKTLPPHGHFAARRRGLALAAILLLNAAHSGLAESEEDLRAALSAWKDRFDTLDHRAPCQKPFAAYPAEGLARAGSIQKASAYGAAAKWYLTDSVLISLNYEVTDFSGLGTDQDSEQLVHTRFQYDF